MRSKLAISNGCELNAETNIYNLILRATYRAGGSAVSLLQPLLDNQVGLMNMENADKKPISMEKAINIIHDVFVNGLSDITIHQEVLLLGTKGILTKLINDVNALVEKKEMAPNALSSSTLSEVC